MHILRQVGVAALVVAVIGMELPLWMNRWQTPIFLSSFFFLVVGAACTIVAEIALERKRLR